MNVIKCSRGFEFHYHAVFDQKVSGEISDWLAVVENPDRMLLLGFKPILSQLDCQSVLVDLFQEPAAERIADAIDTADDSLGDAVDL